MNAIHVTLETLQSLPFSSISGTYAQLGTVNSAVVAIKFTNTTDANLIISTDATNATGNDIMPVGTSYTVYDIGANVPQSKQAFFSPRVFFVKSESADPTEGKMYMTILKRYT